MIAYADVMPVRTALRPGVLSPTLPVPKSIARPEYAWKPTVQEGSEPWVQTPEVIEKMRVAGRIAAGALAEAGKAVAPGVTTDELDRIAHEYMVDHGAYPSTLGYKGFPKSCCTSLNEIICHGIPDSTVIEDGDIVNIDVTAYIDGVHGDTNATFLAGDVSEEHRLLVERTHEATMRAIKAVKPGRRCRSSAASSSRTQTGSATTWFATSPATASAPPSTTGWWSCTTTSPPSRPCSSPA